MLLAAHPRGAEKALAIERLLGTGGYPQAWTDPQPERVLAELVQAFVLRDASDLFRVDRLDAYQAVLQLAARQVGNLLKVSELASAVGVAAATVARYLSLMEEVHVLKLVPSFAGGARREVTSARKVFFVDNGLRNTVLGRAGPVGALAADRGALVENLVYSELLKGLPWTWTVRYWRSLSGAEVDFVVAPPGGILGVEVKAGALQRPRLSRSSRSFIQAYSPPWFWVVSQTLAHREILEGTLVEWVPLHALPERIARYRAEAGPGGVG